MAGDATESPGGGMNATSDVAVVVDGVHKVFGGAGADDVHYTYDTKGRLGE